jgi:hypothetical protein
MQAAREWQSGLFCLCCDLIAGWCSNFRLDAPINQPGNHQQTKNNKLFQIVITYLVQLATFDGKNASPPANFDRFLPGLIEAGPRLGFIKHEFVE